jgi:hypothetical protein
MAYRLIIFFSVPDTPPVAESARLTKEKILRAFSHIARGTGKKAQIISRKILDEST